MFSGIHEYRYWVSVLSFKLKWLKCEVCASHPFRRKYKPPNIGGRQSLSESGYYYSWIAHRVIHKQAMV